MGHGYLSHKMRCDWAFGRPVRGCSAYPCCKASTVPDCNTLATFAGLTAALGASRWPPGVYPRNLPPLCPVRKADPIRVAYKAPLLPSKATMAKILETKYDSQADAKVCEVAYESQADLCWFEVNHATQAQGDAVWCFVDYEQQASFKILWVKYETQADLKVHKVKYAEQAGWRTPNHKLRGKLG